jgi:hypothetical protein
MPKKQKIENQKITVPKICCFLTDNKKQYQQTIRFFHKIFSLQSKDTVIDLDFSFCKFISIDCCVILGALTDCYKNLKASQTMGGNFSSHDNVTFLLNKLGFYQFTNANINFDETGWFEKKFSVLPLDTGFSSSNYTLEAIDNKIRLLFPDTLDAKIKKVFKAISEAILNIDCHAYSDSKHTPELLMSHKSRWFTGIRDLEKNIVWLAVYDLGVGIPTRFRYYNSNFKSMKDADIIANAMTKGVTTSGLKERGLGSEDFKGILKSFDNSFLRIISQKGSYQIDNSGEIQLLNFDCPLKGTLLCWQICLN